MISLSGKEYVNSHQADWSNHMGSSGLIEFQSGVDLVLISTGVVGDACHVVNQ